MKNKYHVTDMNLFGDRFKRMYINEPMTVQEIYAAMRACDFTEEDEVYCVDTEEHICVHLKMIF